MKIDYPYYIEGDILKEKQFSGLYLDLGKFSFHKFILCTIILIHY